MAGAKFGAVSRSTSALGGWELFMISLSGLERRMSWAMLASVMLAAEQQTHEASWTTLMSVRSDLKAVPLLIRTAQFSLSGLSDARYLRIVLLPDPGAPMMRWVGIFFGFLRSLDGIRLGFLEYTKPFPNSKV